MQNPNQQFQKQQKDFQQQMQDQRDAQLRGGAYLAQEGGTVQRSGGCSGAGKMLVAIFIGGPVFLLLCGDSGYLIGGMVLDRETAILGAAAGAVIALFATAGAAIYASRR